MYIDRIAFAGKVDHLLQLGAIHIFAADFLHIPAFDSVRGQRFHLPRLVLFLSRYSYIADFHFYPLPVDNL